MPKKAQKLTRENYNVPKGEEHLVHYLAERISYNEKTGERSSHADLIKTGVKMFDTVVMKNLIMQGYTINILHHPLGKYNDVAEEETPMEAKERELAEANNQIAEAEKEIAEMRKKIAELEAKSIKAKKEIKK